MTRTDADMDPREVAALHDGLSHPARVAALRVLRGTPTLPLAELRTRVQAITGPLDTRTMQHHVLTMQRAGLVVMARDDGRDVVALLRDVAIRVTPRPGA